MAEMGERGVAILKAGSGGDPSWGMVSDDLPTCAVIDLIAHREKTHGNWEKQAAVAQKIKMIWEDTPRWPHLKPKQREALHMIAAKISRILCGDENCNDHWDDISGYGQLGKGD